MLVHWESCLRGFEIPATSGQHNHYGHLAGKWWELAGSAFDHLTQTAENSPESATSTNPTPKSRPQTKPSWRRAALSPARSRRRQTAAHLCDQTRATAPKGVAAGRNHGTLRLLRDIPARTAEARTHAAVPETIPPCHAVTAALALARAKSGSAPGTAAEWQPYPGAGSSFPGPGRSRGKPARHWQSPGLFPPEPPAVKDGPENLRRDSEKLRRRWQVFAYHCTRGRCRQSPGRGSRPEARGRGRGLPEHAMVGPCNGPCYGRPLHRLAAAAGAGAPPAPARVRPRLRQLAEARALAPLACTNARARSYACTRASAPSALTNDTYI